MKCKFRLTRSVDIKRVRRSGRSFAHPLIVLVFLPNYLEISRYAVSTGRSIGNAVKRNRCKRLMRESIYSLFQQVKPGYDFIVLARQPLYAANFIKTRDALFNLFTRAQLLKVMNDN